MWSQIYFTVISWYPMVPGKRLAHRPKLAIAVITLLFSPSLCTSLPTPPFMKSCSNGGFPCNSLQPKSLNHDGPWWMDRLWIQAFVLELLRNQAALLPHWAGSKYSLPTSATWALEPQRHEGARGRLGRGGNPLGGDWCLSLSITITIITMLFTDIYSI